MVSTSNAHPQNRCELRYAILPTSRFREGLLTWSRASSRADATGINLGAASLADLTRISYDGNLDMHRCVNALKIALAIVLCFTAAEDLKGQACQGCTCSGSREVHPATTLKECIQGCSIVQLVCQGRDIIPTTTVIGLGFAGQPKSVPKDCTIRTIPNGGMLTGKPAPELFFDQAL